MSFPSGASSSGRPLVRQENYFSVDEILTTQERIACRFLVPVRNMGYLDPCSEDEHLPVGTQLELPVWMAKALGRKRYAKIDIPKQYKEAYREILNADASVVNLHKLGPYYYGFGSHLLEFEHLERKDIAKSMQQAFQARLRGLMDSSQNARDVDSVLLIDSLDEAERAIFHAGQTGLTEFLQWETRQTEKLTSSDMVLNLKKRKRVQAEDAHN